MANSAAIPAEIIIGKEEQAAKKHRFEHRCSKEHNSFVYRTAHYFHLYHIYQAHDPSNVLRPAKRQRRERA